MTRSANQPRSRQLLLYGAGGLLLLVGAFLGGLIVSRRSGVDTPTSTPAVLVVTATSGPALPTATPGQPLPDGTVCTATPADWQLYTVQAGDTLSELADQAGLSSEQLLQSNCLASPELQAGQQLYLPPPPTPVPCQPSPPQGWQPYTVQAGDTLSTLAATRGTTTDQAIQVNCLTSATLLEGQVLYLPPLPTPTPCFVSPPSDWGIYTVQAGDTLFSLASARDTTAEEIKRVNCLTTDAIQVGQQLYLPLLPTPTPAPTFPPPPTPPPPPITAPPAAPDLSQPQVGQPQPAPGGAAVTSIFNQPPSVFAVKDAAPGGPAIIGRFVPCRERDRMWGEDPPWLSVYTDTLQTADGMPYGVEQGQRVISFVCGFSDPVRLKAWITGPDRQPRPLDVRLYLAPGDRDVENRIDRSQGVVIWDAACDLDPGAYNLFVRDGAGTKTEEISFVLKRSNQRRILVVPRAAPAGSTFHFYYCGFQTEPSIEIVFFYETGRVKSPQDPTNPVLESWFGQIGQWTVPIRSDGWAKQSFQSSSRDFPGRYRLEYTVPGSDNEQKCNESTKICYDLWLLR